MSDLRPVGFVVGGSLSRGLEVRLHSGASTQLGQYLVAPLVAGGELLGMVTDVVLKSAEAGSIAWPPPAGDLPADALLREVLLDTGVYTEAQVNPYLEIRPDAENTRARGLPRHFAPVSLAGQEALDAAFATGDSPAIALGTPLGMEEVEVTVEIEKLFERSAGIFGKSGTGKTVLAIQLLDAMVSNSAKRPTNREKTVALIFDMHNDYGWGIKFQGDGGGERRSLKQRQPSNITVYTLENLADHRVDGRVTIGTRDITPDDLEVLQATVDFTPAAIEVAREAGERFGQDWIDELLERDPSTAIVRKLGLDESDEPANWAKVATRIGAHPGSLDNLRRNLRRLARRSFVEKGAGQFANTLQHIVSELQGGKSVVIQFGRFGTDLTSYMLVANMLSRRIWEAYRDRMEAAQGDSTKEPNHLVIVIEEAHKFVDRSLAGQSIFGQIARELRKFNVTLLVIDQRPSQIDPEVLSQVGTRFVLQLDSDGDVEALVGGVSGRAGLRQVIASLESRQQALAFGHALPMPVVVRPPDLTRDVKPGAALRDRLAGNTPPQGGGLSLYGKSLD